MSQATDKLRTLFNELATGEEINPEVKSKVALALDSLVEVETEVNDAEDSKRIAQAETDELREENKRLREFNAQLTMKLGTAVAIGEEEKEEKYDEEDEEDEKSDELESIIEDYEMK